MGLGDAFGKDSGGEDELEYDDGAFFYLSFTLTSCVALYLLYSVISTLRSQKKSKQSCPCEGCQKVNQKLIPKLTNTFYVKAAILVTLMVCLAFSIHSPPLNRPPAFDPYKILSIQREIPLDENSDKATIKKAYRSLTILYHPDKNPGYESQFIQMTKAYEVLTNDRKRELWQRWGNAEGDTSVKVGLAMPKVWKQGGAPALMLVLFVI